MAASLHSTSEISTPKECIAQSGSAGLRLLVVTEFPPNASGGGPAVVRQLLKNWPEDKLFWWSCFPDKDARFDQKVAGHRHASVPSKLYPRVRWTALKSQLLEQLWAPWASRHLKRTIAEFHPDVLWIIPHDWSIAPIHGVIRESRLRYHVSMHDYVDVHDNPARFGKQRCSQMARKADEIYTGALTTDAICREMAEDLEKRTGKSASAIIRYGVEPTALSEIATQTSKAPQSEIRIAYAGSILVEKEFGLFVEALRRIRSINDKPIRLHLFGANPVTVKPWFDAEWMRFEGNLPELELREKLRACHWGFSPMALTDADPRYNRFSFPTKFIAYLAAGLPVITLGHPESSVMKMASRHEVGISTSADDVGTLATQLKVALGAVDAREHFRREILRCATQEFGAKRMRQSLHACFEKCAGRDREPVE